MSSKLRMNATETWEAKSTSIAALAPGAPLSFSFLVSLLLHNDEDLVCRSHEKKTVRSTRCRVSGFLIRIGPTLKAEGRLVRTIRPEASSFVYDSSR